MQQLYRAQMIVTHHPEDNDFGNKQAPIGDDDIASSITLTGQAVVKQAKEIAKKYVSKCTGITESKDLEGVAIYQDTDSFVGNTIINTQNYSCKVEELYDMFETDTIHDRHGHEIKDVSANGLKVSTFDSSKQQVVWGQVKRLVRHKVSKRKYQINVGGNSIVMTEDHGCMVYRDGVLMRVSPVEIKQGDKMVVSRH